MDKNQILKITTESMKNHLDEMTLDNYEMKQKIMNEYFEFINSLKLIQLPTLDLKEKVEVEQLITQEDKQEINEENTELLKPKRIAYRFVRRLKGGELPEISAFVPHRTVKELELKEGDFLYAEPMENAVQYEGPKRYIYELAERGLGEETKNLKEFIQCKVEKMKELNKLYVTRTLNDESIYKYEEMEHHLFINERDVNEFRLNDSIYNYEKGEGPIVDIAYYLNDPQGTIRVTWNYAIEEREEYDTPRTSNFYKKLKKDDSEKEEVEKDFTGKTILMIGCEPKKGTYREIVEKRGGEFMWASGKEGKDRLNALVRKSDFVLMNLVHVSHRGTWNGVEYCKKHGIPHEQIDNYGNSTFLRTVTDMINEQEDQIV